VRRLLILLVTIAVGWGIALLQSRPAPLPPEARASTPAAADLSTLPVAQDAAVRRDIGFRSRDRLVDHYEKHGREFGRISMDEYLLQAQTLRDRPAGGDVLELVREVDGVVSRFDRASGAFLAFNRDRTIRIYFKPNDGEAYFRRQARRRPNG
jgi:pyocin large subunit-like protein